MMSGSFCRSHGGNDGDHRGVAKTRLYIASNEERHFDYSTPVSVQNDPALTFIASPVVEEFTYSCRYSSKASREGLVSAREAKVMYSVADIARAINASKL
jgi:hypothetical protein